MRVSTMYFEITGMPIVKIGGRDESQMHRALADEDERLCPICDEPMAPDASRMYCCDPCSFAARKLSMRLLRARAA